MGLGHQCCEPELARPSQVEPAQPSQEEPAPPLLLAPALALQWGQRQALLRPLPAPRQEVHPHQWACCGWKAHGAAPAQKDGALVSTLSRHLHSAATSSARAVWSLELVRGCKQVHAAEDLPHSAAARHGTGPQNTVAVHRKHALPDRCLLAPPPRSQEPAPHFPCLMCERSRCVQLHARGCLPASPACAAPPARRPAWPPASLLAAALLQSQPQEVETSACGRAACGQRNKSEWRACKAEAALGLPASQGVMLMPAAQLHVTGRSP